MLVRYLEEKVTCSTNNDSSCDPFVIEYYLLENDDDGINYFSDMKYGIEVLKKKSDVLSEQFLVKNFSDSKEGTRQIIRKFAEHEVTPVSAPFVLDDILGM